MQYLFFTAIYITFLSVVVECGILFHIPSDRIIFFAQQMPQTGQRSAIYTVMNERAALSHIYCNVVIKNFYTADY